MTSRVWTVVSSLALRAVVSFICVLPVALLCVSLAAAFDSVSRPAFEGVVFMIAALLMAALNFGLSFVRPWWILKQRGTLEGVGHVSGAPIIGSLLVLIGAIAGFGAAGTAVLGLAATAFDTGGLLWFLIAVWKDESFWTAAD